MSDSLNNFIIKKQISDIQSDINKIYLKISTLNFPQTNVNDISNRLSSIEKQLGKISQNKPSSTIEINEIKSSVNTIESLLVETVCPSVQQNSWIDVSGLFGSINNSINRTNSKLCELNSNVMVLENILLKLDSILNVLNQSPSSIQKNIIICYPSTEFVTLSSGNTSINFYTGTVTNPDKTTADMSDSLESYGLQYIQSLTIYSDKYINMSAVGDTPISSVSVSNVVRYPVVKISKIDINTTEDTNVVIIASTVPYGSPEISFDRLSNSLIAGSRTNISTTAAQVTTTSTKINKLIILKVRSLGTGSYIAFGNSSSQPFRLNAVDQSVTLDFIDDLSKLYVVTDVGSTGSIEYFGA